MLKSLLIQVPNRCIAHLPIEPKTDVAFQIKSAKIYAPVVTLPINDNIKLLENIKQGFKRTISWNKYRSKIIK